MIAALLIQFALLILLCSYISRTTTVNTRSLSRLQDLYEWLAFIFLIEVVVTAVYFAWKYLP